jgi:hypothetical protein
MLWTILDYPPKSKCSHVMEHHKSNLQSVSIDTLFHDIGLMCG